MGSNIYLKNLTFFIEKKEKKFFFETFFLSYYRKYLKNRD